jgi:pSer/pThr/pTyr-binding forkhead associated (FHA) protein
MAFLFDSSAETFFPLAPHHTFGRLATSVDTHIDKPYVSKLHAAIEWDGAHWRIKNLGLNGTHINSQTLQQGESCALHVGDEIRFAEPNDPGFTVLDLTAPADMLWPLDTTNLPHPIMLNRYHLLPNEQAPELALFFQDQQWHLEPLIQHQEQTSHKLQSGDLVQFNNSHWQLIRTQIYGPTEARVHLADSVSAFEFLFDLSLDEESTQLELQLEQTKIDLGVRSHHYLLLQLARHRANDIARGIDHSSQGWVYADQLAAELGMDNTHMNIHIFRARKQIADALPNTQTQACLLERRGGKLRFGCDKFKIFKGGQLVVESTYALAN